MNISSQNSISLCIFASILKGLSYQNVVKHLINLGRVVCKGQRKLLVLG